MSNNYFFQAFLLPHSVVLRKLSNKVVKFASLSKPIANTGTRSFSCIDSDNSPNESLLLGSNQTETSLCSRRGRAVVGLLPSYLSDARSVSRYSKTNPDGALQLGVAESKMMEDWLLPVLNSNHPTILADAIYYQPTAGRDDFKSTFAEYIENMCTLERGRIRHEGLIVGAGCNAVLENLCITLADTGDGVLIPTPYYAAFEFDLVARAGLQVHPVTTEAHHPDLQNDYFEGNGHINPQRYYPNVAALDAAYERSINHGCQPRILLVSHPMNPLGICYPAETVRECIEWCRSRKVHFICDEIYAGSVYRGVNDGASKIFNSALKLAGTELGPYVHWVYALSKDFAVSGLRIGVAYTENEEITIPMQKLNDLCQISSQTQLWTKEMLQKRINTQEKCDELWTVEFRCENHKRLLQRYSALTTILEKYRIPYLPAEAGLFVWIKFSQFLGKDLSQGDVLRERSLYLKLIEYGLLLTPGKSMRNEQPGFFRFVFTAASDDEFIVALKRLEVFFKQMTE